MCVLMGWKRAVKNISTKNLAAAATALLNVCGKLRANIASDHCSSEETFYVAEGSSGSILSWTTSQKLNLIKAVSMVEQMSAYSHASKIPSKLITKLSQFTGQSNAFTCLFMARSSRSSPTTNPFWPYSTSPPPGPSCSKAG